MHGIVPRGANNSSKDKGGSSTEEQSQPQYKTARTAFNKKAQHSHKTTGNIRQNSPCSSPFDVHRKYKIEINEGACVQCTPTNAENPTKSSRDSKTLKTLLFMFMFTPRYNTKLNSHSKSFAHVTGDLPPICTRICTQNQLTTICTESSRLPITN